MSKIPLIAASFLLGAGALVWWNQRDSDEAPSVADTPSSERVTRAPQRKKATSEKPPVSWKDLTNDKISRSTRLDIARRIDTDLSKQDLDFLLESFNHIPPGHKREQWWLVLNEIMEQMRKKGVAPNRLGKALATLVSDPKRSEVVRDYAVQHLSTWISPPRPDVAGEPSPEVATMAMNVIAETIIDPSIADTSIPGTALMSLTAANKHLPAEMTSPLWQKLDPKLTAILKGEAYGSLATQTTIIQSVALRGSHSHLPLIRQFAHDEEITPSMRLSAIAALGIYASAEDRAYLSDLATSDTRYRYAAQSALKKFK